MTRMPTSAPHAARQKENDPSYLVDTAVFAPLIGPLHGGNVAFIILFTPYGGPEAG